MAEINNASLTNGQIEMLNNMCYGAHEVQLGTLLYNTKDEIDEINITLEQKADKTSVDVALERIKYYGSADVVPSDESYFTVNETGETITGLTDTGKTQTELVIPYKINGIEITNLHSENDVSILDGATNKITKIIIPKTVIGLNMYAFDSCTSLTSINIPNSVTSIEVGAFDSCTSLTSINIPNSVTSIGESAFDHCTSLTSINIPNSVTSISPSAFEGTNLKIYCEQGSYADTYAKNNNIPVVYTDVKDIATETELERLKYYGDKDIIPAPESYFTVNETGETITGLTDTGKTQTELVIPYKINGIEITNLHSENDVSILDGATNKITKIIIPKTVIGLNMYAFMSCTSLTSIDIPNSVTGIEDFAFWSCSSLTSIYIPDSVTSIGTEAFYHCTSLTSINIPNSVTSIGDGAFVSCSSLTSVNIPNSVTSIGDCAFVSCSSLTSVNIPNSVTSIGDGAFHVYDDTSHSYVPISGLTIYCEQGSYAETYAKDNNIPVVYTDVKAIALVGQKTAEGGEIFNDYTNNQASGNNSHAEGHGTIATARGQHVEGIFNIEDIEKKYVHIAGNGTSNTARSNAYTLDWDGNGWFAGDVKVGINNDRLATEKVVDDKIASIISIDGEAFMIDSELNKESKNAVQNKVVTNAINDVQADIASVTGGTYDVKCHATETIPMGKSVVVKEIHTPYGVNTTNATVMCDDCESLMKVGSTVALTCQGSSIRSINDQANSEYVMVYDNNWYVIFEVEVVGEISEIKREIKTIAVNPTNTVVINTQSDFDNMVASSNWLDARFVLFNTNVRATTTITVPSNVRCIDGNGFKITFDSGEYFGYSAHYITIKSYQNEFKKNRIVRNLCVSAPSNDGFKGYRYFYSVDNCKFIFVRNTNNNYGFYECYNLSNCSVSRGSSQSGTDGNYGYYNCKNLIGCVSECGHYDNGFYGCENLMACSAWTAQGSNSGGISGNGFETCIGLSHCKVAHKGVYSAYIGTETKYAYFLCSTLNYCTVEYTDAAQQSCGFKECNNLQNCGGEATNDKVFVYDSCSSLFECTGKINTENCVSVVSIAQLAALME